MLMPQKIWNYLFHQEISIKTFIVSHLTMLLLSLVFLGGVYYILNQDNRNWVSEYTPVTQAPSSFSLEINNPDDNLLTFDKNLTISGKSAPKATIIVSTQTLDSGLEANIKGDFLKIIPLTVGLNKITITAFDSQGNQKQAEKMVYYSEEKLEQ